MSLMDQNGKKIFKMDHKVSESIWMDLNESEWIWLKTDGQGYHLGAINNCVILVLYWFRFKKLKMCKRIESKYSPFFPLLSQVNTVCAPLMSGLEL